MDENLNPGINEVVSFLRDNGFDTCDSGDGLTNVNEGMEGALPWPHVHCKISQHTLVSQADKLALLTHHLREKENSGFLLPQIEATYFPLDQACVLTFVNVNNAVLRGVPMSAQRLHIIGSSTGKCIGNTSWSSGNREHIREEDGYGTQFVLCPLVTGCEECMEDFDETV